MIGWTPETQELAVLALARFDRLSESELKILCAATSGEYAVCGPSHRGDDPSNDPAQAAVWGDERTIRAALIRWLCIDARAKGLVDPRGIQVRAAKIADPLDLAFATVPFPLTYQNCSFAGRMNLHGAQLEALYLLASRNAAIEAEGLKVRGDLFFRNANVEGEVRLLGAEIGGNLDCGGATFKNAGGVALFADGIKVHGYLFLRAGFIAQGEVRLIGADIGKDFECDEGSIKNAGGVALNAEAIKVSGSVLLRKGFSQGEVRLLRAEISGNLECDEGSIKNAGGVALNADSIKVTGSVFLRDGFSVEGEVRLVRAEIGGQFGCDGSHFAPGSAVNAEQASVSGSFFWQNVRWNLE